MRFVASILVILGMLGGGVTRAQTPETLYTWNDLTIQGWKVWGARDGQALVDPVTKWNLASISGASGDLVVTETGNGSFGSYAGGKVWIFDGFDRARENWDNVKGNLDATGLGTIEMDLKQSSSTPINVNFILSAWQGDVNVGGVAQTAVAGPFAITNQTSTISVPISSLPSRFRGNIANVWIVPDEHLAVGNVTWTISSVRSVGTPAAYRDIVTNDAGTPDEGIDGAFPLNTADMAAIVGNTGSVSQLGLSRNAAGSGSLQWTDKGGTGAVGSESGASIGWGNGSGWRTTVPGDPTAGNSYYERMSDFSNYDRMTVRISAQDLVSPNGSVAIGGVFIHDEANSVGTTLPNLNLTTDGQYHDLVFDLSSVSFLKTLQHWGIDVAPHANNIVFNIDNIRLWNSTTPVGVPGDYNGNGTVDAADYVLWRNGGNLQNEGVTPGSNTAEDYTYWRSRFGATAGSGVGAATAVPEPAAMMLVLAGICGKFWYRRSRLRAA